METLKEEQLKQTLLQVLVQFNQDGMSLGTEFYVLKDVFNEFSKTYENFIEQQIEKQKQNEESEQQEEVVEE